MGKNYLKLYTDDVYRLAETLVIKSEDTADKINANLVNLYGKSILNENDKTTWKYYLNISGQYHPKDEILSVVSLDTLQTITFSSENLNIHIATRKDYQYGTRNYNELVSIYPEMEMFILGVLYPVDINVAINADEGTILSYPTDLIEANEVTLISKLNTWIQNYRIRWYSRQFGLSDNYYTTVYLGMLYLNLVPAIINIRLGACKTPEAHSFHVRQYLLSHGMLDIYLDFLTIKQALFFYRNIQYIERNNGKREVFAWLVVHLMSERNLPISELNMRHDVSGMPASLYANLNFDKKPLNINYNADEKTKYSLENLLAKELPLVEGNKEYLSEHTQRINTSLVNSLSSVLATKVLDSSVIDYTDATPYTKHNININHWLYYASKGIYSTYTSFKDPRTGDKITLHCRDAFIYFTYSYLRALGGDITTIPLFLAQRVTINPRVTPLSLMVVADKKYATIEDAKIILGLQPVVTQCVSVDAFHKLCNAIYDCAQAQLIFVSLAEHQYRRAIIENMVARTYTDTSCSLAPTDQNMEAWILSKNIPATDFTSAEFLNIYQQLYENTTGSNLDSTKDLRDLQNAMVGLFSQLSSYSVQFLSEVTGSNIKVFNSPVIRLGDIDGGGDGHYLIQDTGAVLLEADVSVSNESEIGTKISTFTLNYKDPYKAEYFMPIDVTVHQADKSVEYTDEIALPVISFSATYVDPELNLTDATSFIGYDAIWRLPDLQIGDIRDVYCDCFQLPNLAGIDIGKTLLDNIMPDFVYFKLNNNVMPSFIYKDLSGEMPSFINTSRSKDLNAFTSNSGMDSVPGFKANQEIADLTDFAYVADLVPGGIYVSSNNGTPFFSSTNTYIKHNIAPDSSSYISSNGAVLESTDDKTFTPNP